MSLIVTADDFGLSVGVNEAVERAHRDGVLTHASLMVAGPAAADAVARARRLPSLGVGLHVVAVEGPAVLPAACIPGLVDSTGWFPSNQVRLAIRYAVSRAARRQLAAEIEAQVAAFAATGLPCAHVDAHKHMHMHPYVAHLLIRGAQTLRALRVRVPLEPPATMRALGAPPGLGGIALALWARGLRARVRAAELVAPDAVFGLAWSGQMTERRLLTLLARLPPGLCEVYAHPATGRDALLCRLMPDYAHEAELAALLSPAVRAAAQAVSAGVRTRRSR